MLQAEQAAEEVFRKFLTVNLSPVNISKKYFLKKFMQHIYSNKELNHAIQIIQESGKINHKKTCTSETIVASLSSV